MSDSQPETSVPETAAEELTQIATLSPDNPASGKHDASVALAHESFRLRIESAYSELASALDSAWKVYTHDRNIVQDVVKVVSDLGGHNAGTSQDPTIAV